MKKSCFIQVIIVITIFTAAVIYIINNHLNDLVVRPAKKELSRLMAEGFDNEYNYLKNSPEKDSLKVIFRNFISSKFGAGEFEPESIKQFFKAVKPFLKDSVINKSEIIEIKKLTGTLK